MKRVLRKIGKYIIEISSSEITTDNFFKHSVWIKIQGESYYSYIIAGELTWDMAKTFRYSEEEKEIHQALELYMENLKFKISKLEKLL